MQFLTGFPGICKTLGIVLSDFLSQVFLLEVSDITISIIIIWLITLIHKMELNGSYINNIGVITRKNYWSNSFDSNTWLFCNKRMGRFYNFEYDK